MQLANETIDHIGARFYHGLRLFLHKKRWLLRSTQILRAMVILGPLRKSIIRFHQKFSKNKPLQIDSSLWLPNLDVETIVNRIEEVGYSRGGVLPEECLTKIVQFCEKNGRINYWNPHKDCDVIDRFSRNEKIVEIARKYLGAEPILWVTELKWTSASAGEQRRTVQSFHQEPIQYDGHAFHYDALDCKSLTVFVYLTDIDLDSGPHVTIENTHKAKSLRELTRIVMDDAVAHNKYGHRIKTLLGRKGAVIFEDTTMYHKIAVCKTSRIVLKLDYVLQRRKPPERV